MVCRNAGVMFMCGRYQFSLQQYDDLAQILSDAQRRSRQLSELNFAMADPITTPAHGAAADIAPTNIAPVMIASGNRVVGEFQKWGIPNFQGKLVINARAETVTEKPMFRRSIAAQRCVVPASAYYEWDAGKRKYCFTLPDQPLFFAGIYDVVNGMNCFVILTTAPNASVESIHDRMPLLLTRDQVRPWLTDAAAALELLAGRPPLLRKECCERQLSFADLG